MSKIPPAWLDDRMAANGRPVRENFSAWFEGSLVVDDKNEPIVAYHGTADEGLVFEHRMSFFTDDARRASSYAIGFGDEEGRSGANVVPAYLSIRNPKVYDFLAPNTASWYARKRRSLINRGHDGIIIKGKEDTVFIAFGPNQIKSAIGNSGLYLKGSASLDDQAAARAMTATRLVQGSTSRAEAELAP